MGFFSGSIDAVESKAVQSKTDNNAITTNGSYKPAVTEERFTDASASGRSAETRDKIDAPIAKLVDSFASSKDPTKLYSFVNKKNWAGAIKRCKGDTKDEASTWIVEKNNDGSTRWKLLPIHQVSLHTESYSTGVFSKVYHADEL